MFRKWKDFFNNHTFNASLCIALGISFAFFAIWNIYVILESLFTSNSMQDIAESIVMNFVTSFFGILLLAALVVYPVVLTAIELVLFWWECKGTSYHRKECFFDGLTLVLGFTYSIFYLQLWHHVSLGSDWEVVLRNTERHTPFATAYLPTIFVLALVGLAGYLLLTYKPLDRMPPLWIVLSIAAMYIGVALVLLCSIQVIQLSESIADLLLVLVPVNVMVIAARTIHRLIREWNRIQRETDGIEREYLMEGINRKLCKAEWWPVIAFYVMWPLLGILIVILVLFGQMPDAAIKAFTETSSWNLSWRVSPQNVFYDEHYLCTVAAGGHEKIVKPKRLGIRHGHTVIVNRQLCIANAFEQVLEERTPGLHRRIRHIYDTYGFPIAKKIHSPYVADLIYILMKPLEWCFLLVLYLTDVHPEDRIALQYTGKKVSDFKIQ